MVCTAGRCINPNKEDITAFILPCMGKNVAFTHWYLGSALGAPKRASCVFFLTFRDVQIKVTTALGQDMQSEPNPLGLAVGVSSTSLGLPALAVGVAGPVTPSPHKKACGGSCCCLLFPLGLPKNWVEVGKCFLDKGVVSACQEEPLSHRRCFPVRGKRVLSTSPGKDRRKLVHSSILCLPQIPLCCY